MNAHRIFLFTLLVLAGCHRNSDDKVQGYVEGEYVYVASPLAGALDTLAVERGAQVKAGEPLFTLDQAFEKAAVDQAERRVAQSNANFEDLKKGRRPSEIDSLEAQLKEAQAASLFADKDLARLRELPPGAMSASDVDRAQSTRDQDCQRVAQLQADLTTAKLGSRADQIAGAEADLHAQQALLAQAQWNFSQKHQDAPKPGVVFDTLFRPGEWVPAGRPVVALLPPANIKVRAFVPQTRIGAIHLGDSASVTIDGVSQAANGKVTFISPQAEYTPPVIYSRESREKLVFMVEIHFDDETAAKMHPGQPVDVIFSPSPGTPGEGRGEGSNR